MMSKKWTTAVLFAALLAVCQPVAAVAQENVAAQEEMETAQEHLAKTPDELAPDMNDPDYVKRLAQTEEEPAQAEFSLRSVSAMKTKSPFTGLTYTHAPQFGDCEVINGIDVSKWQADIDWSAVKKAGVKYVFIRCGYTSLSEKFAMYEDPYFKKNIEKAHEAGIKVGVYFFSNSLNTTEAKQEAKKTLALIEPYRAYITMPVVYDFEAFNASYRAYGLSKAKVTQNALAYLKLIEDAGFTPIYYGSPSFLEKQFDTAQLEEYECWLAHYTTKSSYDGDYSYWQYASSGTVDGIQGKIDCNFWYVAKPDDAPGEADEGAPEKVTGLTMTHNSTTAVRIAWNPSPGADGYKIYRSKSYGGGYQLVRTISDGNAGNWRDGDFAVTAGIQYYYKIVPYKVSGSKVLCGRESDILTAYLNQKYTYRLRTDVSLNLRSQAGTEYQTVAVVPQGTVLTYPKYTYSTEGRKWYKVCYRKNGKSYAGYLSGSYVTLYTYGQAKVALPLRKSAQLSAKKTVTVAAGTKLTIVGTVKGADGRSWNQVRCKKGGRTYSGYVLTKNLKRV